jgi:hypothetical protein
MLPKDYEYNIKFSFYKFLYERVSADHFINYSEPSGQTLEERQKNRVDGWWKWIDLRWIKMGDGIFSTSLLQVNCNTVIESDRYGAILEKMSADLREELNVDTIPLLDYSDFMEALAAGLVSSLADVDSYPPVPTDNVLIPRFRGSRSMPNAAGDTVNVQAIDYNIYVWRESVLP